MIKFLINIIIFFLIIYIMDNLPILEKEEETNEEINEEIEEEIKEEKTPKQIFKKTKPDLEIKEIVDKPVENPVEKPVEEPVEKPVEEPAEIVLKPRKKYTKKKPYVQTPARKAAMEKMLAARKAHRLKREELKKQEQEKEDKLNEELEKAKPKPKPKKKPQVIIEENNNDSDTDDDISDKDYKKFLKYYAKAEQLKQKRKSRKQREDQILKDRIELENYRNASKKTLKESEPLKETQTKSIKKQYQKPIDILKQNEEKDEYYNYFN